MKYFIFSCLLFIFLTSSVLAYDCPFGRTNDSFPGSCSLYTDRNNDGICDNSQAIFGAVGTDSQTTNYYLWQIITLFIIFQLMGISLIHCEKLAFSQWQKMNNYALLISFVLVSITGLLLLANLLRIIQSSQLRTINWLHAESGLIMILFSLEHIIRRWRYYIKS